VVLTPLDGRRRVWYSIMGCLDAVVVLGFKYISDVYLDISEFLF
jgi:hypothetical protein